MYTVKAQLPGLKPKLYGFTRSKDAEAFADELHARGIRNSLGFQTGIDIQSNIEIRSDHDDFLHGVRRKSG